MFCDKGDCGRWAEWSVQHRDKHGRVVVKQACDQHVVSQLSKTKQNTVSKNT